MAGRPQDYMYKEKFTLGEAFMESPGPDSMKSAALLWVKGFCMGGADTIPGVSGGTVAFITGIDRKSVV